MGRAVLVLAIFMYEASVSSNWAQQGAWGEANCKALCMKIWGSAGAANCFAISLAQTASERPVPLRLS